MMSGDVQRHHRLRHAKSNSLVPPLEPCASTPSRVHAMPPRLPRSAEFPVSHAYRRITVWMLTALCSQTGDAITAVNSC